MSSTISCSSIAYLSYRRHVPVAGLPIILLADGRATLIVVLPLLGTGVHATCPDPPLKGRSMTSFNVFCGRGEAAVTFIVPTFYCSDCKKDD